MPTMKIKVVSKESTRLVCETSTCEFIVVDFNEGNKEQLFKKGLVAEYLCCLSEKESLIDWCELDTQIAKIMNTKVHYI